MTVEQKHKEKLINVFSLLSLFLLIAGGMLCLGFSFLSLKNTPIHSALAKEERGTVVLIKKSETRVAWKGLGKAPGFDSKEFEHNLSKAGYKREAFETALKNSHRGDTLSLSWKKLPITGRITFTQIEKSENLRKLSVGTIILKVLAFIIAIAGALIFRFGFRIRKNITSVTNWAITVRGATRDNSNEAQLKDGFKRALRGEFA